ncbi:methyltransferase [Pendulispora albinea]|uniref:Nuclear transport factor 2 family protein n=1 Tax=Pendulispora albinea TaxID=2741071 RepID=A0ABZ2LQP7_9BACT
MPTHADLIRASYEAFRRGDLDAALALFAPDISWTHPDGMADFGLGGTKIGHAQVLAFMKHARTVFSEIRPMPREFLEDGNRVIVLGTHHMRAAKTGRACTLEFVHSWVLENGKATHFTDYHDTTPLRGLFDPVEPEASALAPAQAGDPVLASLLELNDGLLKARAAQLAAELGVADLLTGGPRTSDELAASTKSHPRALYRLLRTLAACGVFTEVEPGRFAQTPASAYLAKDHPQSVHGWFVTGSSFGRAFADAMHSMRTCEPAFPLAHGESLFTYLRSRPELGATFDAAMADISRIESANVIRAYDFSRARKLVDVGGGTGTLLCAILDAAPNATGLILDQPQLGAGATQVLGAKGLSERASFVGGDFFKEVPAGADTYLLKWILHDWSDEQSIAILRNIRRAMSADGRLLLIEHVVPLGDKPHLCKIRDFAMLVVLGGQERTIQEYSALLSAAGLQVTSVTETETGQSIIESRPAPIEASPAH